MSLELFNAVLKNDLPAVKRLLADENLDVNSKHSTKSIEKEITPLHLAASNGYIPIIQALLAHKKINPNTLTTGMGRTALHSAAYFGQVEACKLLIEKVDPLITDRVKKQLAYEIAKDRANLAGASSSEKHRAAWHLLVGATLSAARKTNQLDLVRKILLGIVFNNELSLFNYLLNLDSFDVNMRDGLGNTLLHYLPYIRLNENEPLSKEILVWDDCKIQMLRTLIRKQADINALNNTGETPLMNAVIFGAFPMVQELLRNNVNLTIQFRGKSGETDIFTLAECQKERKKIYELLDQNRGYKRSRDEELRQLTVLFHNTSKLNTAPRLTRELLSQSSEPLSLWDLTRAVKC